MNTAMNDTLRKIILTIIEKYFNNAKIRLIGPQSVSHSMVFQMKDFDPKATILSAYLHANSIHGSGKEFPDRNSMKKLEAVANHFIESVKSKVQADTIRTVSDALDEANRKSRIADEDPSRWIKTDDGQKILDSVRSELESQRKKIVKAVDTIAQVELSNAQNTGSADGILAVAQRMGISDPVCFKIGVLDDKRCSDCWRLWTLEDKVTPRLYKMSELVADPGKKSGSRNASVTLTHPNCRDVLTVLMPGFGFDSRGRVIYVSPEHDEFAKQRAP